MKLNVLIYQIFNVYGVHISDEEFLLFYWCQPSVQVSGRGVEEWKHAEIEHRTCQKHLKDPFPDLKRTPGWNLTQTDSFCQEVKAHCDLTLHQWVVLQLVNSPGWTEVKGDSHLPQCECNITKMLTSLEGQADYFRSIVAGH